MKQAQKSIAAAAILTLAAMPAYGASLYWDGATPAGAPGGGAGAWDNSLSGNTTNWDTSQAGGDVAWVNANNDTAVFGGTAGTVTLGTSNSVGGLRFDTTGYAFTNGANTLSFGATNNAIVFNNAIAAATITGTVGGAGNVSLSNVAGTNTAGTLTFNGTSAAGWSGTTTIGAGMTLATVSTSTLINKVLSSTTGGITLSGGTIQFTRASNSDIGAINNSAIGVNGGGTFSVTSSSGGASASETIGAVTVNSGQMNFVQTANNANQLVLAGLSRGSSTTSAATFSSPALGTAKFVVTGAGGATAANEIYAPWATTGTAANAQTDYAVFNGSNEVGARGTTASAQSTWSTTHALTSNYTLANAAKSAANGLLSATRSVNTVRNTTASNTATATNGGAAALDYFTLAAHTFANGDVVSASGTGGLLNGGDTYYVINSGVGGADRFQLSTTPGGSPVDLTNTTNGTITGGMTLSTGNNLETYGILNGSSAALAVGAAGTGALTTPSGGGNLFLTTGAGAIFINAPITDNGGAVTVVRNGSTGRLLLTGNNTFTGGLVVNGGVAGSALRLAGTQSFTGGITLNGGGIGDNSANSTPTTLATALNGNAITVNGPSHLVVEGTLPSTSTITINSNAVLKLGAANSALTVQGVVSGSGVLDVNPNNYNGGNTVSLTNTANTFSGDVTYNASNGNTILSVASIGDSGKVVVGMYANGVTKTFELNSAATAPLTFNTRQFELAGPSGGHNLIIDNNSPQAFNINTDLLVSGVGTRTLTLQGAGAGLSTFDGDIGNGSLTSLGITKAETGTWALTNTANSYTGVTNVSGGILEVTKLDDGGSNSSIGASTNAASNLLLGNGTTLRYTGSGDDTNRGFTINGTGGGHGATLDASGTGAVELTSTASPAYGTTNQTRTLTLTGTNTDDNTLAADIANNGVSTNAVSIAKTGIGTWVLSGANTNTGNTTISGGGKLVLDYGTNDNSKIAGVLTLSNGAGDIALRGGSHLEAVTSLAMSTGGGHTSIARDGGSAKLALGAITRTNNGGVTMSLAEDGLATTSSVVVNGILSGGITVGSNWAKVSSGDIVALTSGDYTPLTAAATTANANYQLTGSLSRGAVTNINSLRIVGSGTDDVLTITSGNLTPSILSDVGAIAGRYAGNSATGGILYAGGGNNNYTITGPGNLQAQNGNQELVIHTHTGTLTADMILSMGSSILTKAGAGTLVLTKANTYTGATFVSQGTLRVNGSIATSANAVTVSSEAALGGTGTINRSVTVNGSIAPGNSIGTLNVVGNVTWNGSASNEWVYELGTSNTADLLNITGNFNKGTGSSFVFDFAGSTATGTFVLVDWSGSTTFLASNFSFTNLGGGNTGTFAFNDSQLEFTAVVVPEPTTLGLLGLGAVGLMRRRRVA